MNGIRSSLGVSINLKHVLELHEFSVHKTFPLEANSRMRISIWELENRKGNFCGTNTQRVDEQTPSHSIHSWTTSSLLSQYFESTREERAEKPRGIRVETLPPPESLFLFTINLHYFTFSLLARGPEGKKKNAPPFAV